MNQLKDQIQQLKTDLRYGLLPAMATPIAPGTDTVNTEILPELIEFLINSGIRGLFIGGTTGEGILLTQEQRVLLHARAVNLVNHRVTTLIHVGANMTSAAVALAQAAEDTEADAIVAVTPYYYGLSEDALFEHFAIVAAAAPNKPIFVYDIPHMAVNTVTPGLIARLAKELPSFAGLKSSNGNAQMIRQQIDATPSTCTLLVGNERIALGSLALGADGMISGLATAIPEPFVQLVKAFETGDLHKARHLQGAINRLLDLLPATARLGAIKQILNQRGITVGRPIPPRPPAPANWTGWPEMALVLEESSLL